MWQLNTPDYSLVISYFQENLILHFDRQNIFFTAVQSSLFIKIATPTPYIFPSQISSTSKNSVPFLGQLGQSFL